uniref:Uncharacterized protein n=1 Tax=Chelonoidis abingdonii TaxID=106734 RepID=A0A8C0H407_CHEAB
MFASPGPLLPPAQARGGETPRRQWRARSCSASRARLAGTCWFSSGSGRAPALRLRSDYRTPGTGGSREVRCSPVTPSNGGPRPSFSTGPHRLSPLPSPPLLKARPWFPRPHPLGRVEMELELGSGAKSLVTLGCDVQKNKNRTQLGLRSLMSKGTLGQAKVTSTLTPSHSASSSRDPRTRHEKKPVALSRKIATRKLGRAARILRKATMSRTRNSPKNVVAAAGTRTTRRWSTSLLKPSQERSRLKPTPKPGAFKSPS